MGSRRPLCRTRPAPRARRDATRATRCRHGQRPARQAHAKPAQNGAAPRPTQHNADTDRTGTPTTSLKRRSAPDVVGAAPRDLTTARPPPACGAAVRLSAHGASDAPPTPRPHTRPSLTPPADDPAPTPPGTTQPGATRHAPGRWLRPARHPTLPAGVLQASRTRRRAPPHSPARTRPSLTHPANSSAPPALDPRHACGQAPHTRPAPPHPHPTPPAGVGSVRATVDLAPDGTGVDAGTCGNATPSGRLLPNGDTPQACGRGHGGSFWGGQRRGWGRLG
ncbi:hypothetical protein HNP84_001185 [Thermocatellispora tengchongensis]|uniref:Uncharacterized protein n=1 Tax=Thermocatellispora tengchongensis TaxID=1073253 RepID=A0A840NXH0_9ACTN|nr:hypothetical protein [Thermocatellispora tengchongensis]